MSAPRLAVEPWRIVEPHVDPDALDASEAVFTLANGYLGMRGSLDEAEPNAFRGTYMSGVHETHPLSYPEGGYGHPDEGQAIIAVADGTPLRVTVDGEPLDIRTIHPQVHERILDLRTGVLERRLRWRSSAGTTMELRSRRLVSLAERPIAAIRWELRALDGPARVTLRSELVVGATPTEITNGDPRVAEALESPVEPLARRTGPGRGALAQRTRRTRIGLAAAVAHLVDGDPELATEIDDHHVVTTVTAQLAAGQALGVTKTISHVWSKEAEADALLEGAIAACESGRTLGFAALVEAQRRALDDFWARADVQVEGDDELQQALRYALFQLHSHTARLKDAPLGGKGLTGAGYSGHTFWDTEGFVVPALTLLDPEAAARLLSWRAGTLDRARDRAAVLGMAGACFPWRTIDGRETSAYWPASTAAVHLNADISRAFWLYGHVTGQGPRALSGTEVLVETARLWMSTLATDAQGGKHIFGVTGPDEYTGVVDDNVFTNLMARTNLVRAADACAMDPATAAALDVGAAETDEWRSAAASIHVPYDEDLRVHPMNAYFTSYREWRFEDKQDSYPVQEHQHYAKFYRRQVIKQADLVQALWWCREYFTDEDVARNVDYYEARTVRDSSLSAAVQAVTCAQAQHPDLALRYLRETALVDLRDLRGDTKQGLHMAAVAGAWLALVAGLGGLREDRPALEIAPLLPRALDRMRYHVTWRGVLVRVETTRQGTTLSLPRGGGPVDVVVDGEQVTVTGDAPVTRPLRRPAPLLPEPSQPAGRDPMA